MKHLPKIYPLALIILIVLIIFVGSYAIASDAHRGIPSAEASEGGHLAGVEKNGDEFSWYEDTAIFICPIH